MLNTLAKSMPDYVAEADTVANSPVTSTLLRLPSINDGEQTAFHLSKENERAHSYSISRKALAKAIVSMLDQPEYDNESIAVTL
jgi:hypothetical protein